MVHYKKITITIALLGVVNCALGWVAPPINIIPPYSEQQYDAQITADLTQLVKTNDVTAKVIQASGFFLGKPYVLFPNGEASYDIYDHNPLYRTDAFDCLTYVSTVIALAHATDLPSFQQMIKNLDYEHGEVKFIHRNHFTSCDYNPRNQAQGYLKDITGTILSASGQSIAQPISAVIDKPHWYKAISAQRIQLFTYPGDYEAHQLLQHLQANAKQVHPVPITLSYIPLEKLFAPDGEAYRDLINQIPPGSIIEIIRPNWLPESKMGTKVLVSHLGFVISSPQGLVFREASSVYGKVLDVPLVAYLRNYYLYDDKSDGINIEQVK